jgi:hypothetical protein
MGLGLDRGRFGFTPGREQSCLGFFLATSLGACYRRCP